MTGAALSWNFDDVDISAFCRPREAPASSVTGDISPTTLLDIIFEELKAEADRPVRDRINEALRQWHLRLWPPRR